VAVRRYVDGAPEHFCCFITVRWNRFAGTAIESMDPRGKTLFGPMTPPAIPVTHIMVHVCVAMSLLSQWPLFLLVTQCIVH
jgi:hypothetical protein